MAARNTDVEIPALAWTEVTDSDLTGVIRIQNLSEKLVYVQATTGAAPAGATFAAQRKGSIRVRPWMGEVITVADMFPGVAGADRVWVYSLTACEVSVSHA